MTTSLRFAHLFAAGGAALLIGCASNARTDVAPQPQPAPVDAEGRFDTAWAYLAARYDADGDGRVTRAEYDRDVQAFARLDADADGALEAEDFADELDGVGVLAAQLLLGLYLQDDADPDRLDAVELERAFGIYDVDFDARLTATEFEAARAERTSHGRELEGEVLLGMELLGAYRMLLGALDEDADGALGYEELMAFQGRFFADGNLMRVYLASGAAGNGVATPGETAPDFTLPTASGEGEVTLSEFRGRAPVALIFGSYT